jgi:outer membrane lipoprotein-sorting protein
MAQTMQASRRAGHGAVRVAAAALALLSLGGASAPKAPDLFDEIHARAQAAETKRQTIRARFTQTTVSSLLAKPVVARGTLLGAKPARLVMTYTSPERKTIVMDGTRVVITRDQGKAEQTDVTEIVKKVNHYFVNATPDDLRKSFTVRAFIDPEMVPASYQIDLVAKRKQIRQGLERLQIWITRDPLLLSQIKMTFPGGDSDTITVSDAELNVPLPANAFDTGLPQAGPRKK